MTPLEKIGAIAQSNLPDALKLELIGVLAATQQPTNYTPIWVWPYWQIPAPWQPSAITWLGAPASHPNAGHLDPNAPFMPFTTAEAIQ